MAKSLAVLQKQLKAAQKKASVLDNQSRRADNVFEKLDEQAYDAQCVVEQLEKEIKEFKETRKETTILALAKIVKKQSPGNLTGEQAKLLDWAIQQLTQG